MPHRPVVDPDEPLGRCPSWPTMFSFGPAGERAVQQLSRYEFGEGEMKRTATPRLVLTAIILHLPEDAGTLVAFSNYSPAAGPMPPPGTLADALRRRTHVRLPSAITLRLNRLIEHAGDQTGQRCSRTAIVSSM